MAATMFSLLAFCMVLTTVMCLKDKMVLPKKVISLHQQCAAVPGYAGECWSENRANGYPHCGKVACASAVSRGIKRQAHFIGNAPNGLKCGTHKVCYEGECKGLAEGVRLPRQTRTDPDDLFDCYIVGGTNTRRN